MTTQRGFCSGVKLLFLIRDLTKKPIGPLLRGRCSLQEMSNTGGGGQLPTLLSPTSHYGSVRAVNGQW